MTKNFLKTKEYKQAVERKLFLMRVGSAVYKARKDKELNQKELAKGVQTTQRIISLIENAEDYNFGADLLYRIFKFLDTKVIIGDYDMISGANINDTIIVGFDNVCPPAFTWCLKSDTKSTKDEFCNDCEKQGYLMSHC